MTCARAASPIQASAYGSVCPSAGSGLERSGWERMLSVVLEWQERMRQRHALESLDDRLLRDIGLTRAEVDRELQKSFWRE
jgi:uncharacterized protein YjiS (DUF1127 family)